MALSPTTILRPRGIHVERTSDNRAKVVVEPPAKFREWVASLKQEVPKPLQESILQDTETNPVPLDSGGA